jgi:hypothetical protein
MSDPKAELLKDHEELERLLALLVRTVDSSDECQELPAVWRRVEALLLDHIRTEERQFFPLVAPDHRAEVEELRAEHQHIRASLAELGLQVELHCVRKPEVDELVAFLRRHAERENDSLYQWLAARGDASMTNIVRYMLERRQHRSERVAS